jgi:hypothetical protein
MKMSPIVTFLVVLSVTVNVALAVGFVWLAASQNAHDNADTAQNAAVSAAEHDSALTACRAANINRGQDKAVWAYLLRPPPHASATVTGEITHLRGLVAAKDTLRNCAALYSVKPLGAACERDQPDRLHAGHPGVPDGRCRR